MVYPAGSCTSRRGCIEGHESEVSESERIREDRAGRGTKTTGERVKREDCVNGESPSLQYHGQYLVIGLDRHRQGFSLIKSFLCDLETDDDRPLLFCSSQQLGFGRKRRLGTLF